MQTLGTRIFPQNPETRTAQCPLVLRNLVLHFATKFTLLTLTKLNGITICVESEFGCHLESARMYDF